MIRVLVLANNVLLAKAVVSVLAEEIDLGTVWVSHQELGYGSPHSLMVFVDEGPDDDELQKTIELFRDDVTLLVLKVALTKLNIHLYESYHLNNPETERIISLVRDFSRANLKKNARRSKNASSLKKMKVIRQTQTRRHKQRQTHDLLGFPLFVDVDFSLTSINRSQLFVPHHIRRNFRASVTPQTGINLFPQKNLKVNRFNVNTEVIS
jgi:hypothetical protein